MQLSFQRMGVVFIGPSGAVMRALGDKSRGKQLAEQAGGAVERRARAHARGKRRRTPGAWAFR